VHEQAAPSPDARHVLVTGASNGLGRALALAFAAPGVRLGIHYASRAHDANDTAHMAEQRGASVYLSRADFSAEHAWPSLLHDVEEQRLPLDVLVLNAGAARPKRIINMTENDWDAVLNVNYRAHVHLLNALSARRLRHGSHVLVTGSLVGLRGEIGLSAYAASKGALLGFVRDVARRLGPRGICVNAILPGVLRTAMTAGMTDEQFAAAARENALGRGSTCEEIARAAVFITTLRNASGQVFALDSRLRDC